MNREFVPYEQSLALKGIEFDEPCLAFYYDKTKFLSLGEKPEYLINKRKASYIFGNEEHDVTLAPTFSSVFRWFREKYKIDSNIKSLGINKRFYSIYIAFEDNKEIKGDGNLYKNYEEAELECLKNLIEIVKEKQNGETI